MHPGEAFEIQCHDYLAKTYTRPGLSFQRQGGMDSTISDIAVVRDGKTEFYMEVKDAAAQSGQFVLLPGEDTKQFYFSPRNFIECNEMVQNIINYMNRDFDRFNNAGTAGEALELEEAVFANWIMGHYRERNVKYIITFRDGFVILPIRKFSEYFAISAKFRIKKSGSAPPAKKDIPQVTDAIRSICPGAEFAGDGKHLFAAIPGKLPQDRFVLGKYTYYLSETQPGEYEIRRLSNTYNMNVIFSIRVKQNQSAADLHEFEAELG